MAIHGGQNLKAEKNENIFAFVKEYLLNGLVIKGIKYVFESDKTEYYCFFDSASIGLIIDNVFSNSLKAHSDQIIIRFVEEKDAISLGFYDNGTGLKSGLSADKIFEYGATTTSETQTRGFGIGLNHIKQLACEMGGDVSYDDKYTAGFGLIVRLRK